MLTQGAMYRWGNTTPANTPTPYAALICYKIGLTSYIQYCFSRGISNLTYKRTRFDDGEWSDWLIVYDSGLLNSPNLLSPLASALGVTCGGIYTTDTGHSSLNECIEPGIRIYTIDSDHYPSDAPSGATQYASFFSAITQIRSSWRWGFHIYSDSQGKFYIRNVNGQTGSINYGTWKQINLA